ncbi:MAG: hypothetical protein R2712_30950 [Vicinamibacterales bacterium]
MSRDRTGLALIASCRRAVDMGASVGMDADEAPAGTAQAASA